MKILYFSPHPHINMAAPSGPGTHIREIIAGFEAQGHTVIRCIAGGETIAQGGTSISFSRTTWKKVIPSILWSTLRDLSMVRLDRRLERRLNALIKTEQPDLIYERSCYGMRAGMRAAHTNGIRYVVEMNAPYPEEKVAMQGKSLLGFLGNQHERKQVAYAYRTIVVSSAMKNYLVEKTQADPQKIVVVANAVNPARMSVDTTNLEIIRSRYQLSTPHRVVGFVGSIFPYHGVDQMIESFAQLEKEHPHARMLIVGDGEIVPKLRARVDTLRLADKIHFTGNVPHHEVYTYLSLMDVAVMARSNWYGSPVKLFEYGAMRKAIIAPNVIPVQDVMQDHVHGLLISEESSALTKALRYMLTNTINAEEMADTFHKKVMREHTWEQVAKHILISCT